MDALCIALFRMDENGPKPILTSRDPELVRIVRRELEKRLDGEEAAKIKQSESRIKNK
jgi:hypothetical protein